MYDFKLNDVINRCFVALVTCLGVVISNQVIEVCREVLQALGIVVAILK
jgi:hypothetical protein